LPPDVVPPVVVPPVVVPPALVPPDVPPVVCAAAPAARSSAAVTAAASRKRPFQRLKRPFLLTICGFPCPFAYRMAVILRTQPRCAPSRHDRRDNATRRRRRRR